MSEQTKSFVARLFKRHHSGLMRYLTARVRSAHDARDIAQETYLRLLQLDQVDFIRDPQSYLFRIASNLSYEFELKQLPGRMTIHSLPDVVWAGLEAGGAPLEDKAEQQAQLSALSRVLDRLEPRYAAVLILHRRDGLTYPEIAEQIGISTHTVKKYLGIALRACREGLASK